MSAPRGNNYASVTKGMPKKNAKSLIEAQAKIAAKGEITPLDYMIELLNNKKMAISTRLDAAKAAAPYVHRKMPIAIEGGDSGRPISIIDFATLKKLPEAKLILLMNLLKEAGSNIEE